MSFADLLPGLVRKDVKAWRYLYDSLLPGLKGYAVALCGDPALADDLLQALILALVDSECAKLRRIEGGETGLRRYMRRAVLMRFIGHLRKHGRLSFLGDKDGDVAVEARGAGGGVEIEEVFDARQVLRNVDEILHRFPPDEREFFRLCFVDGRSVSEAARMAGVRTSPAYKIRKMLEAVGSRLK